MQLLFAIILFLCIYVSVQVGTDRPTLTKPPYMQLLFTPILCPLHLQLKLALLAPPKLSRYL